MGVAVHARVLFTRGKRTITLHWLDHTGTDVIHGTPDSSGHMTYHATGRMHRKTEDGQYENVEWHAPLRDLRGVYPLIGINFPSNHLTYNAPWHRTYDAGKARSKLDAMLMIDSRTISPGIRVQLWVGLLDAGNGAALSELIGKQQVGGRVDPKQVLIATSVEPWVWAMVSWQTPAEAARLAALSNQCLSDTTAE